MTAAKKRGTMMVLFFLEESMWDEDKHPRAEDGRFGKKSGNEKLRSAVDVYSDDPKSDKAEMGLTKAPEAYKFNRRDTQHHYDHAKEMGLNQREYESAARNFFNSDKGKLYFDSKDKKYYRFDDKSQLIAIVNAEGQICSYYKCSSKYFERKRRQLKLNEL